MVNITRSETIPKSLQQPEIQQYLDDLADFKAGILKAKPKPNGLRIHLVFNFSVIAICIALLPMPSQQEEELPTYGYLA